MKITRVDVLKKGRNWPLSQSLRSRFLEVHIFILKSPDKFPIGLAVALLLLVGCNVQHLDRFEAIAVNVSEPEADAAKSTKPESADWPQLFGPARSCFSTESGVNTRWDTAGPHEIWRVPIGKGYSSPIVANSSLILMHRKGDNEVIEGFDGLSGESQWSFSYPTDYVCKYE